MKIVLNPVLQESEREKLFLQRLNLLFSGALSFLCLGLGYYSISFEAVIFL